MLLMMAMMAVGAVDQISGHLHDAAGVNRNQGTERQRAGGDGRSRRRPPPVRFAASKEGDDFPEWNLPQKIAEEDEKKQRPEKRDEAVGMFLERGTKDFDAQEFHDGFEKVSRAVRHVGRISSK